MSRDLILSQHGVREVFKIQKGILNIKVCKASSNSYGIHQSLFLK